MRVIGAVASRGNLASVWSRRRCWNGITLLAKHGSSAGNVTSRGVAVRGFSSSSSGGRGVLGTYAALLERAPLATKALTAGFIVAAGDGICQLAIEKKDGASFDWVRLSRFFATGAILVGPTLHVWFGTLFRAFPPPAAAAAGGFSGMIPGLKRLAADQLVFAPIFNPVFITFVFALEGRIGDVPETLKNEWVNMTVSNWSLWGPAQLVNFQFVPVKYQVLFANCVAVIWNTYLSWKAHEDEAHHAPGVAKADESQNKT